MVQLRLPPRDLVSFRNHLAACTLTVSCMRPGEDALARTCYLCYSSDYNLGLLQYQGCSTLTTLSCKQDQIRKGHQLRFGVSLDPQLDLPFQLECFMDAAGTRPCSNCTKAARPGARCLVCLPLFPKLSRSTGGAWTVHSDPVPSVSLISSMVVSALGDIGIRSPAFTGASCCMGGLTVATEAGVPEAFMWMRSGHAQDRAARRYVRLTNPDSLSDAWRAFNL